MILALALLAATQGAHPPAPEPDIPEPDLVVIGRRMAALSVIVGRDPRGRFTCGLNGSSGDARLDEQLCRAAAKCVREGAGDQASVTACIDARKPALLGDLRKTLAKGARQ